MNELTLVDYGLLAIVLVSGILSLFRGFVREAVSLVSWIVAFWAAWVFGESFAEALAPWLTDPVIRLWVARLVLFVCVLLVGGLLGLGLGILLREGGLSALNRFIGIFFGLARGVVLVAVLLVVLEMAGFSQSAWWQESKLIPYAAPVTDGLREFAREGLDYIDTAAVPAVPGLPEGSDGR